MTEGCNYRDVRGCVPPKCFRSKRFRITRKERSFPGLSALQPRFKQRMSPDKNLRKKVRENTLAMCVFSLRRVQRYVLSD